jgi:hypothetical protein
MADPIRLSEDETATVLETIFSRLRQYDAVDVMHGIEESRRLGVEEDFSKQMVGRSSDLKKVGAIRRRPPANIEMLSIVFEQLRQRLIVLPAIVDAIERHLGANQFALRVDREFVSPDLINTFEANMDDLRPPGFDQIIANYERVRELLGDLVPPVKTGTM